METIKIYNDQIFGRNVGPSDQVSQIRDGKGVEEGEMGEGHAAATYSNVWK